MIIRQHCQICKEPTTEDQVDETPGTEDRYDDVCGKRTCCEEAYMYHKSPNYNEDDWRKER